MKKITRSVYTTFDDKEFTSEAEARAHLMVLREQRADIAAARILDHCGITPYEGDVKRMARALKAHADLLAALTEVTSDFVVRESS